MDDVNTGPTALDGLPIFLHFKTMEIAPMHTNTSTKPDKAMMAMVLGFNFWLLLTKSAVMGRPPALPLGPLPM